jgi:hypothetical protein
MVMAVVEDSYQMNPNQEETWSMLVSFPVV